MEPVTRSLTGDSRGSFPPLQPYPRFVHPFLWVHLDRYPDSASHVPRVSWAAIRASLIYVWREYPCRSQARTFFRRRVSQEWVPLWLQEQDGLWFKKLWHPIWSRGGFPAWIRKMVWILLKANSREKSFLANRKKVGIRNFCTGWQHNSHAFARKWVISVTSL